MAHASLRDETGLEAGWQFAEQAPIPIQSLAPDGTVLQANRSALCPDTEALRLKDIRRRLGGMEANRNDGSF